MRLRRPLFFAFSFARKRLVFVRLVFRGPLESIKNMSRLPRDERRPRNERLPCKEAGKVGDVRPKGNVIVAFLFHPSWALVLQVSLQVGIGRGLGTR